MYCYVAGVAPAAHQPTTGGIMQVTRRGSIGLALALGLTAVSGASQAGLSCASLTSVTPEASTITAATLVTPPATINNVAVTLPLCPGRGGPAPAVYTAAQVPLWPSP